LKSCTGPNFLVRLKEEGKAAEGEIDQPAGKNPRAKLSQKRSKIFHFEKISNLQALNGRAAVGRGWGGRTSAGKGKGKRVDGKF